MTNDPYDLEWLRQTLRHLAAGERDTAVSLLEAHSPDQYAPASESWDEVPSICLGQAPKDTGLPATTSASKDELFPSNAERAKIALLRRDEYRCAYCRRGLVTPLAVSLLKLAVGDPLWPTGWNFADCHPIVLPNFPVIEHVWPKSLGGHEKHQGNLVASCWRCNLSKGNTLLSDLGWNSPHSVPSEPFDGLVEETIAAWYALEINPPEGDAVWPSSTTTTKLLAAHTAVDADIVNRHRPEL